MVLYYSVVDLNLKCTFSSGTHRTKYAQANSFIDAAVREFKRAKHGIDTIYRFTRYPKIHQAFLDIKTADGIETTILVLQSIHLLPNDQDKTNTEIKSRIKTINSAHNKVLHNYNDAVINMDFITQNNDLRLRAIHAIMKARALGAKRKLLMAQRDTILNSSTS